ncbi:DUF2784 domain-containing protein [Dyella nitratireducens]|uniref:DUF2784 domain-containing protein n=1 Tax=Dyella nitratireducens TaxID=1849580 RepID=A0ABQ1FS33_9GAMM|nr:DUF2784 domain-containing protein [Dyella nitratireducens]GGA28872.1 hypothetical protein GCM10010981_17120 [Dyella nitratireducens]GLQ43223.1 hypothetical protein GCM10007902_30730 [Dyella nitratireducens]
MFLALADAVLAFHLAFILFVCLGAWLALKWRWVLWLQLPAAAWGVFVEASGWICPLTSIENYFRERAGESAYQGDCIGHYLTATIYPDGLTRNIQYALGAIVLIVNGSIYLWLLRNQLKRRP